MTSKLIIKDIKGINICDSVLDHFRPGKAMEAGVLLQKYIYIYCKNCVEKVVFLPMKLIG